jgi:hypothetical protein
MSDRVRFQIEMPREKLEEIEQLMNECCIETRKEFFNNALTLLKWAVREKKLGHSIGSIDEARGRFRELQIPMLSHCVTSDAIESDEK